MESVRADARTAKHNLNVAVHTVRNSTALRCSCKVLNLTDILSSAIPYLDAIIENRGGGIPDRMAAQALDLIYSAEAISTHEAIKLARNNAHDVLVRACVQTLANPHDQDGLQRKLNLAFGRDIENSRDMEMRTRLLHAKRTIFGEGPHKKNRRRPARTNRPPRGLAAASAVVAEQVLASDSYSDGDGGAANATGSASAAAEEVAGAVVDLGDVAYVSLADYEVPLNRCARCGRQDPHGAHDKRGIFRKIRTVRSLKMSLFWPPGNQGVLKNLHNCWPPGRVSGSKS